MSKQQILLKLPDYKSKQCPKCNGIFFVEVTIFKIIPGLVIGKTENMEQPIGVNKCVGCGYIDVPKGILSDEEIKNLSQNAKD